MSMLGGARNTVIYGGTFTVNSANNVLGSHGDREQDRHALQTLEDQTALSAFHNSKDRYDAPKCLPRTREAVFREVSDWIHVESMERPILWLYGPAGAGKSAIAQSVAEKAHELGYLLVASFFFNRTIAERNNAARLIPSLAYQMLFSIPSTREFVINAVLNNPRLSFLNAQTQIRKLIVEPLLLAGLQLCPPKALPPMLIVLDGLDECQKSEERKEFLHALNDSFHYSLFPLIILCTSRPESDIRTLFNTTRLSKISTRLVLGDHFDPDSDIQRMLNHHFQEIKQDHPLKAKIPRNWPSRINVETLIRKSSGQFIYASTVVKYISSRKHDPMKRLEIILNVGADSDASPFKELDALYLLVLSFAEEEEDRSLLALVVGMICLPPRGGVMPFSPVTIDNVLAQGTGRTILLLDDLHSVIDVQGPADQLRPFHASLADFLGDRSRSGQYYVDPELLLYHHTFAYFQVLLSDYLLPEETKVAIKPPADFCQASLTTELLEFFEGFPWESALPLGSFAQYLLGERGVLWSCGNNYKGIKHKGDWTDQIAFLLRFSNRASKKSPKWENVYRRAISTFSTLMVSDLSLALSSSRDVDLSHFVRSVNGHMRRLHMCNILMLGTDTHQLDTAPGCQDIVSDVLQNEGSPSTRFMRHNSAIFDYILDLLFGRAEPWCCEVVHWGIIASSYDKRKRHNGPGGCSKYKRILSGLLDHADRTSYLDQLLPYIEAIVSYPSSLPLEMGSDEYDQGVKELEAAISRYKEKPISGHYDHSIKLDLSSRIQLGPSTYLDSSLFRFTMFSE